MTSYKVRAKYVTCRSQEAARMLPPPWNKQELAISGYVAGDVLPPSVPLDDIAAMLRDNLIVEIPE